MLLTCGFDIHPYIYACLRGMFEPKCDLQPGRSMVIYSDWVNPSSGHTHTFADASRAWTQPMEA